MKWFTRAKNGLINQLKEGKFPTDADFAKRTIAHNKTENESVLTIFLFMDHDFNNTNKKPLLYETIIIGGNYNGMLWRYDNEKHAIKSHSEVVKSLKQNKLPFDL